MIPLSFWEALFYPLLWMLSSATGRDRLEQRRKLRTETKKRRRAERKAIRELLDEAKVYEQLLIGKWTQLGFAHLSRSASVATKGRSVKHPKVDTVKFARGFATPETVYFMVEVSQAVLFGTKDVMPYGVRLGELINEQVLFELSHACKRKVSVDCDDPQKGVWLLVHRTLDASCVRR
jgi:hypothetical protein